MKLQLEGQSARVRLAEAELDRLLAGDALRGLVKTPLGAWAWSLVLGGEASLACPVPGEWRVTAPEADFRAFTSERPRRDGFTLELPVPDSAPLQVSLEVDVRDSRRRQVASAGSG
jgi:hypothetical protein